MVSESAAESAPESMSTVYNGSVPCAGCGQLLDPVAAAYSPARECHHCRRRRHRKHAKRGMA